MTKTTIINALVFDGHSLHRDLAVTFQDGVICSLVSTGDTTESTIIDGTGFTLLPGLIDAHIHLANDTEEARRLLFQLASFGVTTALDMGLFPSALRESLRGQPGIADLRFADNFATSTGSIHSRFPNIVQESLVDNIELAVTFVKDRVAEGADYIKIVCDIPGPSQEVVNTLVAEARKHGKLSVAHASRKASFVMAQEGKVDIVTHVPLDYPLGEKEAKLMHDEGRVCVPTLIMEQTIAKAGIFPGLNYSVAAESVAQLHKAGVAILAGTDANQSPRAGVKHGEAFHQELALLVDAGLSTTDALKAATSLPAKWFQMEDRGEIAVGKRADLVLVRGNPVEDITVMKNVERVWISGEEVTLKE